MRGKKSRPSIAAIFLPGTFRGFSQSYMYTIMRFNSLLGIISKSGGIGVLKTAHSAVFNTPPPLLR